MRDRLIELVDKAKEEYFNDITDHTETEYIVETLLNEGAILPPCKVGETVYCLIQGFENPLKATVNRITVQKDAVIISCSVLGYFGQSYMATDFGNTVFLTKEEAEENLKEREG